MEMAGWNVPALSRSEISRLPEVFNENHQIAQLGTRSIGLLNRPRRPGTETARAELIRGPRAGRPVFYLVSIFPQNGQRHGPVPLYLKPAQ